MTRGSKDGKQGDREKAMVACLNGIGQENGVRSESFL